MYCGIKCRCILPEESLLSTRVLHMVKCCRKWDCHSDSNGNSFAGTTFLLRAWRTVFEAGDSRVPGRKSLQDRIKKFLYMKTEEILVHLKNSELNY